MLEMPCLGWMPLTTLLSSQVRLLERHRHRDLLAFLALEMLLTSPSRETYLEEVRWKPHARHAKKELRRERAALEELRQQFKADSQRMRASGSAAFGQALLKEVKTALDERASALNRAIDDFRAMQGGSRVRGGRGSSTARGDTGGASTPTPRSAGVGAVPAEEADVIRRWQHLLGPGSLAGAASTTPVPRSARGLRQSSRDSHERIRSNSPVSSRRSRATREAVDQHLHWLYNFSRDNVSSRPASARGSRAFGGRLGRGYY